MARYIDADNFCGWLETVLKDFGEPNISIRPVAYGTQNALKSVLEVVKKQPAADVVEVVRCGKCKHWSCHGKGKLIDEEIGMCYNNKFPFCCENRPITIETDFCSYGEKK